MLLRLGVPITIGERWTVTPAINYTTLLDGGVRRAQTNEDHLYAGVSVSFEF